MNNQPSFTGFNPFAETWNGRLAMLGFTLAIITEALTGKGIIGQLIAWFSL
ncbi:chlorophyll a/b-binding protein [Acaryochloris sp. IP29b_bin.148]|uniref:chlorophyll a/b-binding protein n=1 Tax=Acaryochloris sp. IP29b_bin.148 TaxID=2969218 RepID=UPI00260F5F19|nr:chlorophyll a/b-binding protein [Acaryochloris sp. IP29b_bin.148]